MQQSAVAGAPDGKPGGLKSVRTAASHGPTATSTPAAVKASKNKHTQPVWRYMLAA